MSVIASALKHMLAAGMAHEDIVRAVADMEAAAAPMKSARQLRNARYYEARKASEKRLNASNSDVSDDSVLNASRTHVEDKTSNSEIEPQEENKKRAKALSPEFDEFWTEYPNKVGKPKALVSFNAARSRATHAEIMDGLRRYIAGKPVDRPWLNPATFLNQDRFNDQPATVTPVARGSPAFQAPSMSELIRAVKDYPHADQPEPPEDRSGFRAAIPHLRAVGTG